MAVIVDLRKDLHTTARVIGFLIGLSIALAGLGGCNSKIAEDCNSTRDVWTSVKDRGTFTRTIHDSNGNHRNETVYELQLVADGYERVFDLEVTKETYDRAYKNGIPNRLNFKLDGHTYMPAWYVWVIILSFFACIGGGVLAGYNVIHWLVDYNTRI
jgi:hypothetical protein